MKRAIMMAGMALLTGGALAAQGGGLWVGVDAVNPRLLTAGTSATTFWSENQTDRRMQTEEISFVEHDGVWQLRQKVTLTEGDTEISVGTTVYDAATLAPVAHWSNHTRMGSLSLRYDGNRVQGKRTAADGTETPLDVTMEHPAYDPRSTVLIARTLPLAEGYETRMPVAGQGEGGRTHLGVRVEGSENVKTGDEGWTDTWVVMLRAPGAEGYQKVWITKDTRIPVRTESSWNGRKITGWTTFTAADSET